MSTQSEALNFAKYLEAGGDYPPTLNDIAIELRRLHNESQMYAAAYFAACKEFRKIRDQRDELLELVAEMNQHEGVEWSEDLCIKINSAMRCWKP